MHSDQSPEARRPYPPRKEPIVHLLCPACCSMVFYREAQLDGLPETVVTMVTCPVCGVRVELVRPKSSAESSLKGFRADMMWIDEGSNL